MLQSIHPARFSRVLLLRIRCGNVRCSRGLLQGDNTVLVPRPSSFFRRAVCSGQFARLIHCTRYTSDNDRNGDNTLTEDAAVKFVSCSDDDDDIIMDNNSDDLPESFTDVPGATNTKSKTLAIIYTCKVCNTRSAKQVRERYIIVWISSRICFISYRTPFRNISSSQSKHTVTELF